MIAPPHPGLRIAAALLAALVTAAAPAVGQLKPGQKPPPIALATLDGNRASLADMTGNPVVVVFGELYHEKTLQACGDIRETLEARGPEAAAAVKVMLVVAQDAEPRAMLAAAQDPRLPALILHDRERRAYADYRISVMPTVVVVDDAGRVVHAVAGYTTRLKDIVADALLLAAGAMSRDDFESLLHPREAGPAEEARVRAGRLSSLARQLARRGLDRLAEEKYAEALETCPDHVPARLGISMVRLRQGHLAKAEEGFRAALLADPASAEATLGLVYVQTLRGGTELDEAEAVVRRLIRDEPQEPRAHYLLGLIHDQRGAAAEAAPSFRRAAELLMSRRNAWDVVPGSLGDGPK